VATRWFAFLMVLALGLSACSSAVGRPAEFGDMSRDEVGCTVKYGDDDLYVIGPLGPSDAENVEPNDYTLIRLGRTASDIVVATDFPNSSSNGGMALSEIPTDGLVVARGPFRDGGTPGYSVTCWRGDS
jgi:hypothetical protein